MLSFDRFSFFFRRFRLRLAAAGAIALLSPSPSGAAVEFEVTRGQISPIPVIVLDFLSSAGTSVEGKSFSDVIRNDLSGSGLFRIVAGGGEDRQGRRDPQGRRGIRGADLTAPPDFDLARLAGGEAVLDGRLEFSGDEIDARFRLWDAASEKSLLSLRYIAKTEDARRLAHLIANDVYKRLTGYGSYFDTRIAFIDETGTRDRRRKRLAVMDQDGHDPRYLTPAETLVLTPRFAPDGRSLIYLAFEETAIRLRLLDIYSGEDKPLTGFSALSEFEFAPSFSPDGKTIAMSLTRAGQTNLYAYRFADRSLSRLTSGAAIDTSPSFSPQGDMIVFESDRGGSQQLYTIPTAGGSPKRISFGEGRYSTPAWSPRGDLIAFTKIHRGQFAVGVIRPDGSDEQILTVGYHNEAPTWAPDGRTIAFFREERGSQNGPSLWRVSIIGGGERKIPTPNFASDPVWSPPLADALKRKTRPGRR